MAYVDISLTEMETFLKRAFRALRPDKGTQDSEYYYDLKLSPTVIIRVWTSIKTWGGAADVGDDAIRIQFYGSKVNRPLVSGKAPIVKRTNSWKNSLQEKIEDYLELYEEKADQWDARGGAEPGSKGPSASDKQVKFILGMAQRASEGQWKDTDLSWPVDEGEVKSLTSKEASRVIETLLGHGLGRRYASEDAPAEIDIRAILREQVRVAFQSDMIESRIACEGACGKTECTCGGTCTCGGNCKGSEPVVAKTASSWKATGDDPIIASIFEDDSV